MTQITSSVPSLIPDEHTTPPTNSAALLLPHQELFQAPILSILRDHYATFGELAHWAPVKGFGRIIIVWKDERDCGRALEGGDYLKLDYELDKARDDEEGGEGYFRHKRQSP